MPNDVAEGEIVGKRVDHPVVGFQNNIALTQSCFVSIAPRPQQSYDGLTILIYYRFLQLLIAYNTMVGGRIRLENNALATRIENHCAVAEKLSTNMSTALSGERMNIAKAKTT
jgi:hypothetical protein